MADLTKQSKKKETPFLDFYYECMETGQMLPGMGLCATFRGDPTFDLLGPEDKYERTCTFWGASDLVWPFYAQIYFQFTPLRQNIVLFCAAINGEL